MVIVETDNATMKNTAVLPFRSSCFDVAKVSKLCSGVFKIVLIFRNHFILLLNFTVFGKFFKRKLHAK